MYRMSTANNACPSSAESTAQTPAPTCTRVPASGGGCRKQDVGWRKVVRNFTPSWFAVNMGTGIVSVLLHQLPYNAYGVTIASYVFFALNVSLFFVFTFLTAARYVLYPEIWPAMVAHPAQSLFLGCFPMALSTIVNMMAICGSDWGDSFIYFTWSLWWIDAALSMSVCISMPFIVMSVHKPNLEAITAALLLPIVPTIVVAASGGILAEVLPDKDYAFTTLVASYIFWGIGESLSACVLAMYLQRLTIHSLPAKEVIVSVFLPIGPLGQGGFGIQQLGKVAITLLPQTSAFGAFEDGAIQAGRILYVLGVFLGLIMWGFGLVWLAFALISIITTKNVPFSMGWWGYTFPLGVLAVCSGSLAENLDSEFFKVVTMILTIAVILLWILVASRTTYMAIRGDLLRAPCLKNVKQKVEPENDPGQAI